MSGRLYVSLTDPSPALGNLLVSDFESREELGDALACSCFLPAFSGYRVPRFRGRPYLDGGFSNNIPVLDPANTIRVSPFSGSGKEISPRDDNGWIAEGQLGSGGGGGGVRNRRRSVNLAGENFYLSRANLQRGLHAAGAVSETQLASYYLAGYRDANRFFTRFLRSHC